MILDAELFEALDDAIEPGRNPCRYRPLLPNHNAKHC